MSDTFLRAKKSLGQNFLKDPHFLKMIADAARLGPNDQVVEIGPGLGHLTRELARRSGRLLAIELDDRLIGPLRSRFADAPSVQIVHADALRYDFGALEGAWKVVANLPYYISTPLIQHLLKYRRQFTLFTLMLQKEVAERIAAHPGGKDYGFLSVLVQLHAVPRIEFFVPARAFTPRPNVDSAVLSLTLLEQPAAAVENDDQFIRVIKAAFGQRRKILRNSLGSLGCTSGELSAAELTTGIDLGRRAETLTVTEFGDLANALQRDRK